MDGSVFDDGSTERFDYESNLARAKKYEDYRGALWPPHGQHLTVPLDLSSGVPEFGQGFRAALSDLRTAIDSEWTYAKEHGVTGPGRLHERAAVAAAMRKFARHLPADVDRRAVLLRAGAVENGYDDDTLKVLATIEETVTLATGQIPTWYGTDVRRLPTAFACRRDDRHQAVVATALEHRAEVSAYLRGLHADLRLGDVPAFAATQLFFLAGGGNLHPEHIAYVLPDDEGTLHSPFKKTYYFANTHRALLEHISAPLATDLLALDAYYAPRDAALDAIPTLGVLSHEFGRVVHRPATSFERLDAADRWVSFVFQEVAADVFGILSLADVWAGHVGIDPGSAVAYHLSECLRYTNRGLGYLPDSDGRYLQLSYLIQLGALDLRVDGGRPRLTGECSVVLAGLRSLARVLADFLLAGTADHVLALYRDCGPANHEPLRALIDHLRHRPSVAVESQAEAHSAPL